MTSKQPSDAELIKRKEALKPCNTVVRTLKDFDENKIEEKGWRVFDALVFGTSNEKNEGEDVAFSSRYVAAIRAIETERPDRIFEDKYAHLMAGDAVSYVKNALNLQIAAEKEGDIPYWCSERPFLVARTKFFDDFLVDSAAHGIRQIVLLGAGMDSRAQRFAWPEGTTIFEIDRDDVIQYKKGKVEEYKMDTKNVKYVAGDLLDTTNPWFTKLLEVGFSKSQPTAWLLEGLLYYFTEQQVTSLLDEIRNVSAPGSTLGADVINKAEMDACQYRSAMEDPKEFFHKCAWKCEKLVQPGDPDVQYNRFIRPFEQGNVRRAYFVELYL